MFVKLKELPFHLSGETIYVNCLFVCVCVCVIHVEIYTDGLLLHKDLPTYLYSKLYIFKHGYLPKHRTD